MTTGFLNHYTMKTALSLFLFSSATKKKYTPPNSHKMDKSHPLRYKWKLWFHHRKSGGGQQFGFGDYEKSTHPLASFDSVEGFWGVYSHLVRPSSGELPFVSEYQIFKQDIKPIWEDAHNIRGGKWVIRLRKNISSNQSQITEKVWESIILSVLGGIDNDDGDDDEIAGVVLSVRRKEDIISIWTTDATNQQAKEKIKQLIQKVLEANHVAVTFAPNKQQQTPGTNCFVEYRVHLDSMIEGSTRDDNSNNNNNNNNKLDQQRYQPKRTSGRPPSSPENQSRRSHHSHHHNNHSHHHHNNNNSSSSSNPRRIITEAERASVRGNPFE